VTGAIEEFYAVVGQGLKPWSPPAPQVPATVIDKGDPADEPAQVIANDDPLPVEATAASPIEVASPLRPLETSARD
jgi:hypothetical protein